MEKIKTFEDYNTVGKIEEGYSTEGLNAGINELYETMIVAGKAYEEDPSEGNTMEGYMSEAMKYVKEVLEGKMA